MIAHSYEATFVKWAEEHANLLREALKELEPKKQPKGRRMTRDTKCEISTIMSAAGVRVARRRGPLHIIHRMREGYLRRWGGL